jgi:XTP/dITP diphosphohydrolase
LRLEAALWYNTGKMTKLLVASNNPHKLQELRDVLAGVPFDLVAPADVGLALTVLEDGATYAENATRKARAFAAASGLLTLADDSGLEVQALGGRPGLRSARYAGEGAPNARRIAKLLGELANVPWEQRQARFVCVMAIAPPGGEVHLCAGECAGSITFSPRGEGGFGYDPVFFLPEHNQTMAELPAAVKNQISHRGRAGQAARAVLAKLRKEQ